MGDIRVSDSELEVMKVLWKRSPVSAGEIAYELCAERDWAESTVKSFLARLVKKGAVEQRRIGRSFEYRALIDKESYVEREGAAFLRNFFDGAPEALMLFFARKAKIGADDFKELEKLIREQEEK